MFDWIDFAQIVIIAILMYMFYRSFIQNTQSEKIGAWVVGTGWAVGA